MRKGKHGVIMIKKIYPYEYSSVQLSKFFGISVKGIEYYEKKGLISPKRIGIEKDRRFNLSDTYKLFLSRYFKQADFSINEIHSLLQQTDINEINKILNQKVMKIHEEEIRLHTIERSLTHTSQLLTKVTATNKPIFEIITRPAMNWLFVREINGPHTDSAIQLKEYKTWNQLMPITHGSLKYSLDDIKNAESNELNPSIGMLVLSTDFNQFNLQFSNRVQSFSPLLCLHTILIGDANDIKSMNWLIPAKQYLRDHSLKLCGDIITSLLLVKPENKFDLRYDEAWLPIEKIK